MPGSRTRRPEPMTPSTVHTTALKGLTRTHSGKVRDIYAIDGSSMLIVTTDRLSAFDVILPDPIPWKGHVLNEISNYWFARTVHIVPNHLTGRPVSRVVTDPEDLALVEGRAVIVRRLRALPIEAVVRGYLIGSGWKDYRGTGKVCGIVLPAGLQLASKLPAPIFTPATKAEAGAHDINISFDEAAALVGADIAARVREIAIALYTFASEHAAARGLIIADTKFEFGIDDEGRIHLIDEALTPDSSRFWPADTWRVGESPPSFDMQFVSDYLESLAWNKQPPAPRLPAAIIARTSEKYREALARITGPAR